LQNLSSVYNTRNANLTNLNITGKLQIGGLTIDSNGNITTSGNISSVGNITTQGNLSSMGNLSSNGNLSVGKNATLGKWTVIGNSIGIPGIADMNMGNDAWLRLVNYGAGESGEYAGVSHGNVGFTGKNLWCGQVTTLSDKVTIGPYSLSNYPWCGGESFGINNPSKNRVYSFWDNKLRTVTPGTCTNNGRMGL
jgi:hypothetical protein